MDGWWLRWGRERELFECPGQPTGDRPGLIHLSVVRLEPGLGFLPTDVTNPDVLFHQMEAPSYWRLEVDDVVLSREP